MSIVTIGDFKNYLQTVANAVSSGKMNVNDAEVKSVLQTIAAAVGEVSATPTANTLADRLKAIADRLGEVSANPTTNTVLARLRALEGYLDGVEAALGTQSDAEATGNGSIIAILKRLRAILSDVWNDTANALNVQLTGSNIPETQAIPTKRIGKNTQHVLLVNAMSIPAGGNTGWVAIDPQGCKKIILWVVCDKQWKMENNTPVSDVPSSADHLYPDTWTNAQTPTIGGNYPRAIVPGVYLKTGNVNNVPDALLKQFFWPNMKIRLSNVDTDTATVTIRAQLIWD